jgi:hypothetical protein
MVFGFGVPEGILVTRDADDATKNLTVRLVRTNPV